MRLRSVLLGSLGRMLAYSVVLLIFSQCWITWYLLYLILWLLLLAKSFQLVEGIRWILREGQHAARHLAGREETLRNLGTSPQRLINQLNVEMYALFRQTEPGLSLFGLHDRKWRFCADGLAAASTRWARLKGESLRLLRDLFFRYNTQAVFGSFVIAAGASPVTSATLPFLDVAAVYLIMAFLVINSFLMAGEVLVGNALMKGGYSRYFHFIFTISPEKWTEGTRRVHEIKNFSTLALLAIIVIASVCMAQEIVFGGFKGVVVTSSGGGFWAIAAERASSWLQFFYFATTTFTTVGFGDVYADDLSARVLVTVAHFLTFGYVLFLLQTLFGQGEEAVPEGEFVQQVYR